MGADPRLVLSLIHYLPVIEAEEALHQSAVYASGSGMMKQEDRTSLMRKWQRRVKDPHMGLDKDEEEQQPRTLSSLLVPGVSFG